MKDRLAKTGHTPIHASTLRVVKTVKRFKETVEPEAIEEAMLDVQRFEVEPGAVSVTLGGTVNLGDYESAKFSVTVTHPCYKEETDDAYEALKIDVLKKAMDVITEYRSARHQERQKVR